jgi:iron complex outermembrane recepter protein
MHKRTHTSARAMLLAGAACATFTAGIQVAEAQDTTQPDKVEKVVVTGSRIQRKNLETANPTSIVTADQLYRTGNANLADLLVTLPQFSPAFGVSRTQSTFAGAQASGQNQANQRNLGGFRTVVLINGRRAPAGSITTTAVDFNTIPSSNIERIEVLTGGASAVYGADAVAGVINIITKKNYDGFGAGIHYGASEEGDNINPRAYMTFGSQTGDGRGYLGMTAEYEYQGLVSCADRFLCSEDFAWNPPGAPVRGPAAYSAVAPQGTFIVGAGNGLTQQNWTLRTGNWVFPFVTATDGYNRNPRRDIAQPTSRILFQAEGEYEILPRVRAFAEVNYGSSKTDSKFEGNPFQSIPTNGIGGPAPFPGLEVTIPISNPFIPSATPGSINLVPAAQDIRAAMVARGDTELSWSQRLDFFGLRGADNHRQTHRIAAGLEGDFDSLFGLGSDWAWEASYVFGRTTLDSVTEGLVDLTHLYEGLRVVPSGIVDNPATPDREDFMCASPVARAQGCVPINPFGGAANNSYTQRMSNYIATSAGQRGKHELEDAVVYMTGDLFELPGGPLQIAVGAEWRRTLGDLDYDAVINNATVIGNQIADQRSQNKWQEVFGEVSIPVITDASFTKELRLEGSYRTTHADGQGTYDTYKYGGVWEPIAGIKFRAVEARAVRAPNTGEQSGRGQTFGAINDPCAAVNIGGSPNRAANCTADGFTLGAYNPPLSVQQNVGGYVTGNPNLTPEIADTVTYGLVLTPDLIPGFSLTLDRFEIVLEDAINTTGRQNIANLCYDLPAAERGAFCSFIQRGFNPNVSLNPNPAAYSNLALVGVDDLISNVQRYDIKGVDLEVSYGFEVADFVGGEDLGALRINTIFTFYDEALQLTSAPGATPVLVDLLGFAGGSTSDQGWLEKQGRIGVMYALGDWSFFVNNRYIGEAKSSPFAATVVTIDEHWYHDFQGTYDLTENYRFYVGVNNIADQDPPFFPTSTSGTQALDTIPGYYDVFGRSYYAGIRATF